MSFWRGMGSAATAANREIGVPNGRSEPARVSDGTKRQTTADLDSGVPSAADPEIGVPSLCVEGQRGLVGAQLAVAVEDLHFLAG